MNSQHIESSLIILEKSDQVSVSALPFTAFDEGSFNSEKLVLLSTLVSLQSTNLPCLLT